MHNRFLLLLGLSILFSLSIASAKNYEIRLSSPAKVGSERLAAGKYDLKVDGSEAIFTSDSDGKKFKVPAKVETGDQKFDQTSVKVVKDGDGVRVESIRLQGSNSELHFN